MEIRLINSGSLQCEFSLFGCAFSVMAVCERDSIIRNIFKHDINQICTVVFDTVSYGYYHQVC